VQLLLFNLVTDTDDPVLGFAISWIRALAERFSEIDVITMRAGRVEVPTNVTVHSVGKEQGFSELRRTFEFYRVLGRLLSVKSYGACFAHMMPLFAVMGTPLLRIRRVPIHLWYAHKATPPTLRLAERMVDRVFTSSPEGFRLRSSKVTVIGQGIDTRLFVPSSSPRPASTCFTITSVGRIEPIKRLEVLIEAVRLLRDEHGVENLQLRLIGSGSNRDRKYALSLHKHVENACLESVVTFCGPLPWSRVAHEYQRSDVVVNVSDTGSLDKALLEAMSCAIPVVTSNAAFRSVLAGADRDLIVIRDSPREVALACKRISAMPTLERNHLGKRLRQVVVMQHSLDHLADRLASEIVAHRH
jgi:glycosyltransferase involved in cell wall biosynthesis